MRTWIATTNTAHANFFPDNPNNHSLTVMGVAIKPMTTKQVVIVEVIVDAGTSGEAIQIALDGFERFWCVKINLEHADRHR